MRVLHRGRSRRGLFIITIVLLSAASAVSISAPSAGAATAIRYADYLPTSGGLATARAAAAPTNQCATPLAQRSGPWICQVSASKAKADAAAATTSYCNVSGCFERYDDFHADWASSYFEFGWTNKFIGTGNAYINWQLTGTVTRANPAKFSVDQSTVTAHMSGTLSNGAPNVANGGSVISGPAVVNFGAAAAGTSRVWPNGGYYVKNGVSFDQNQTVQFSWTMSGYSGYWYVWVRSIVSHSNDKSIYRFDAVNQLPGNDYGSGWTN